MMLDNFLHNRLGMTGLIGFFVILLIVSIIPIFMPINLGESDNTQTNTPPGLSMMVFPKELEGNVADISNGPTFGAGVDKDGNVKAKHIGFPGEEVISNELKAGM